MVWRFLNHVAHSNFTRRLPLNSLPIPPTVDISGSGGDSQLFRLVYGKLCSEVEAHNRGDITRGQLTDSVAKLFGDEKDLMDEFTCFLPRLGRIDAPRE